ncbi:M24 family metallopeptidase [Methanobacterium spitsbergense]|uniref:Xaa-Pro peptidase family protein n=1 Tax=Methanobacterium spitsbergense TaxID=2874285 RepID=A0A8T5UX98_9EURY|nr:Xaa-Pro peptidase family protein [Methanobacterium spitsbergense]MBZ2165800.1 Xaa-Pro peptidase family protein [Methanobacterium spitsbergense]
MIKTPVKELENRMERFRTLMDEFNPEWEIAVIFSKINLYYFTGTMQEGMLIIPRNKEATFWVRRSYERALNESLFQKIESMNSFRDAVKSFQNLPDTVHLETEVVPLAFYKRFQKHFPFNNFKPLDNVISTVRAIKSEYELAFMRKAGQIHQHVLEDMVPEMLKEKMSETDLAAELFRVMINEGHHGVTRFGMFDTEIVLGQIGFGESSIYPNYFNGPGGNYGMSPAVPVIGCRDRKLKSGDLVFIDVGCGVEGYNTDKTMTYMYGQPLPKYVLEIHSKCVSIQNEIAELLKPGAIPSEIYNTIINSLEKDFLKNFMGFGNRRVNFLGHGIGLLIDETPVIANGFNEPLQEGMVLALEPKKGIKDIGMVGIENTFIVTSNGGECITGNNPGLISVF